MNKTSLSQIAALVLSTVVSASALGATFPSKPEGMAKETAEAMKAYPDVKVQLGKALTTKDLQGKTETELSLMRNSIYAQAGLKFDQTWVSTYFHSRPWYKEGTYKAKMLNKTDFSNAKMIYEYQKHNKLLTTYQPYALHRKAAGRPAPAKELRLGDKDLRKALINMRYCDVIENGDYSSTITFHHNNKVTLRYLGEGDDSNGPYSGSYGSAYDSGAYSGDAYNGGNYGGAGYGGGSYSGNTAPYQMGDWKIAKGFVHVDVNGNNYIMHFGTRSFAQHRCFTTAGDIY